MLGLELGLLLLESVNLETIGVGLGDLCEVQQTKETREYDKNNGVAHRSEHARLGAEANGVLVTTAVARAIHGEAA